MTYDEITARVAQSTGTDRDTVNRAYRAYWRAVRSHVASLPLKEDLTDDEFMALQPNVNIPSIGKLHVTLDRYHNMKKMFNIKKNLNAAH